MSTAILTFGKFPCISFTKKFRIMADDTSSPFFLTLSTASVTEMGFKPTTTWPVWLNGWLFIYKLNGCSFESRCGHLNFRYHVCFVQEVPDIQATIECKFTLKRAIEMIIT